MTSLKNLKITLAALALGASGLAGAQNTLLNASYDVAREFYKDAQAADGGQFDKIYAAGAK